MTAREPMLLGEELHYFYREGPRWLLYFYRDRGIVYRCSECAMEFTRSAFQVAHERSKCWRKA